MHLGRILNRFRPSPKSADAATGDDGTALQAATLDPPTSPHGLDPARPEEFARRLDRFRRSHAGQDEPRSHGCLQIFDLDQIRLRFGRRWAELRGKAFQLIEGALHRRLGTHDLYVAAGDERVLVLATGIHRHEADRRARLVAGEITERLCGAVPGGVALRVRTLPADLGRLLDGVASLDQLDRNLAQAMQVVDDAEKQAFEELRPTLVPAWQPVLAPARGMVGAYRLRAMVQLPDGPIELGALHPGTLNGVFDAEADLWALDQAAATLPRLSGPGRKALLIVPIAYETLASMRLREPFLLAYRRLPDLSSRRLLVEVQGIPPALVQARVRELMAYLRPLCLGILVTVPDGTYALDHLDDAGIAGVGLLDHAGLDVTAPALLATAARRHGMRTFLFDCRSTATCQQAARLPLDYLAGDGFMPAMPLPGPVVVNPRPELGPPAIVRPARSRTPRRTLHWTTGGRA